MASKKQSNKRHMSKDEEFQIMRTVFDKFLLLGILVMMLGLIMIVVPLQEFLYGFIVMIAGALLMIIFATLLVKEFHFIEK